VIDLAAGRIGSKLRYRAAYKVADAAIKTHKREVKRASNNIDAMVARVEIKEDFAMKKELGRASRRAKRRAVKQGKILSKVPIKVAFRAVKAEIARHRQAIKRASLDGSIQSDLRVALNQVKLNEVQEMKKTLIGKVNRYNARK
jgi:hypothetical protein